MDNGEDGWRERLRNPPEEAIDVSQRGLCKWISNVAGVRVNRYGRLHNSLPYCTIMKMLSPAFPSGTVKWDSHGESDALYNWQILKEWLESKGLTFPSVAVTGLASGESRANLLFLAWFKSMYELNRIRGMDVEAEGGPPASATPPVGFGFTQSTVPRIPEGTISPTTGSDEVVINGSEIAELARKGVRNWTVHDVGRWVNAVTGSETNGERFVQDEIDGVSLLLLNSQQLQNKLGLKLGPAVKLNNALRRLKGVMAS